MNKPLSSDDIYSFFDDNVNIYTYDQLADFNSIEEVLAPFGRAVLLYFWQTHPRMGHWTCLFKTPRGTIEFFDSLSTKKGVPDGVLSQIPHRFRDAHGEDYPYLTKLLYESPSQIEYNDKKLQNDSSSVCGRYCVLRLICDDLSIEQFQQLFSKNTQANDQLVLQLTK
jgi:hypothetical protein